MSNGITTSHPNTWRRWVAEILQLDGKLAETVVQALCLAAPSGPRGFRCVDSCRCVDSAAMIASELYAVAGDEMQRPLSKADEDLRSLTRAVELDLANPPVREMRPRLLAAVGTIVSVHGSRIAVARAEWPRVWEQLLEMKK